MSRRTPAAAASGLAALLALLGVIVGLPMLLLAVAADPVPDRLPTLQRIGEALSRPDDGTLFLGLLTVVAWVGWAWFTGSVVLDLVRRATRRGEASKLELPVSRLVGAALVLLVAAPTAASAGGPSSAAASASAAHAPAAAAEAQGPAASTEPADGGAVKVEPGDTLWAISDEYLGDPYRYVEIFDENRDAAQPDGRALTDPDLIRPGWTFTLPDGDSAAGTAVDGDAENAQSPQGAENGAGLDAGIPVPDHSEADEEGLVTPLRPEMSGGGSDAEVPPAAEADEEVAELVTPLRVVPSNDAGGMVGAVPTPLRAAVPASNPGAGGAGRAAAPTPAAAPAVAVVTPMRAAASGGDLPVAALGTVPAAAGQEAEQRTEPAGWRVSRDDMLREGIDPAALAAALGAPDGGEDEAWTAAVARNGGGVVGQDWRERIADLFTDTR